MATGDLLLFYRELGDEQLLVALNMGSQPIAVSFLDEGLSGRVLLSTFTDREREEVRANIDLRGNEGLLVIVKSMNDDAD
jgi:alpha-glucosidase